MNNFFMYQYFFIIQNLKYIYIYIYIYIYWYIYNLYYTINFLNEFCQSTPHFVNFSDNLNNLKRNTIYFTVLK